MRVTHGEKIIIQNGFYFNNVEDIASSATYGKNFTNEKISEHWEKYKQIFNKRAELKRNAVAFTKQSYFSINNNILYTKTILKKYQNELPFKMAIEKLSQKVNERILYGTPKASDFILLDEVNDLIKTFCKLIQNDSVLPNEFKIFDNVIKRIKELLDIYGISYNVASGKEYLTQLKRNNQNN